MQERKNWAIKTFLFCFVCNGILISVFLMKPYTPVVLVSGGVLTLILWLLVWKGAETPRTPAEAKAKPKPLAEPASSPDTALSMLRALQREGRLVDFLLEDLAGYEDSQIGAAVRNIHTGCNGVLKDSMQIKPVYVEKEGTTVTVPAGFDAGAIRLTGNVRGDPPFRGVLRHHGWKVERIRLPQMAEQAGLWILAPAEVEIE
jgi:hypothetical protein